jgi:hypothetical protein
MTRIFFIGVLLFLTGTTPDLYAQIHTDPFNEIDFSLSAQSNINDNRFHESWNPSTGISGSAELPFYVGMTRLSARYDFFESNTAGLPDIDQLQVSLGWMNRLKLLPRFRAGGGFSMLGSVFFFKNAGAEVQKRARESYGSTSPESEVGVGLSADLTYNVSRSWKVRLELNRTMLFTSTKLKMTYIGIGVVKTLDLPDWITEVLQ